MKAVIDTNVVAYLLLGTEGFIDEARACLAAVSHPVAPAHWEAELTNVVWMAVRAGILPAAEGPVRLSLARRLGVVFVELAARTGCPLLTFDKALVKAFPEVAMRPLDWLAA